MTTENNEHKRGRKTTAWYADVDSLCAFIQSFVDHHGNVAAMARDLHYHRNTIMYRLDQLTHLTGYNIRNADELAKVMLLLDMIKLPTKEEIAAWDRHLMLKR